jgi:RNA polymerase sigma-70 factor (ECF subfamily)
MPDGQEFFDQQMDSQQGVSSIARSHERKALESEAIVEALSNIIRDWKDEGEFARVKVLELLFVKGWANKDVAGFLDIKEQQVANIRFAAVRKMNETLRQAGLPPELFPGLAET